MENQLQKNAAADDDARSLAYHAAKLAKLDSFELDPRRMQQLQQAELDVQAALRAASLYVPISWELPAELWTIILEFMMNTRYRSVFGAGGVVFERPFSTRPLCFLPRARVWCRLVCRAWADMVGPMVRVVRVPMTVGMMPETSGTTAAASFPNVRCVRMKEMQFVGLGIAPAKAKSNASRIVRDFFDRFPGVGVENGGFGSRKTDPTYDLRGANLIRGPMHEKWRNVSGSRTWTEPNGDRFALCVFAPLTSLPTKHPVATSPCIVLIDTQFTKKDTMRMDLSVVSWRVFWMKCTTLEKFMTNTTLNWLHSSTVIHVDVPYIERAFVEKVLSFTWPVQPRIVLHISDYYYTKFPRDVVASTNANVQIQCDDLEIIVDVT